jgi:hypothetical protein
MATKRKRRKTRGPRPAPTPAATPPPAADPAARGYARGRKKDEEARRALKPLAPGERPRAVTVGAIAAALLALANLIAVLAGWDGGTDADTGQALAGSLVVTAVICVVAVGMWQSKYWAVLGMQTLLAITIIIGSLGLVTATSIVAALVLVVMIAAAGTLFWFLVKAMARIQMPERPGASRR